MGIPGLFPDSFCQKPQAVIFSVAPGRPVQTRDSLIGETSAG